MNRFTPQSRTQSRTAHERSETPLRYAHQPNAIQSSQTPEHAKRLDSKQGVPSSPPSLINRSGRTAFNRAPKVRLTWHRSTDMIRPGKLPLNAVHRSAICTSSDASHGVTPSSCCSEARSVALNVPAFALYLLQVLARGHCSFALQLRHAASPYGFTTRPAAVPGSRPRNTRCSSSWRSHRI